MAMIGRELGVTESGASQCSSGCQSGWTHYLEHSGGHQLQLHRPVQTRAALPPSPEYSGEEDSLVSDASSGPPPRLREEEDDEVFARDLDQRRQLFGYRCYSSSSGSGCFGSTRPRSPAGAGAGARTSKRRRGAAAVDQGEEAVRHSGVAAGSHDNNGDLDDTASSSAVFTCPMRNELFPFPIDQPSYYCALSSKHLLQLWPAVQTSDFRA